MSSPGAGSIWELAAKAVIERFGDGAVDHCLRCMHDRMDQGDERAAAAWIEIAYAVAALRNR